MNRRNLKSGERIGFKEFMFGNDKGWWVCLLNPLTYVFALIFITQYYEYRKYGRMPDPEL